MENNIHTEQISNQNLHLFFGCRNGVVMNTRFDPGAKKSIQTSPRSPLPFPRAAWASR